jgi:hypothetical protein
MSARYELVELRDAVEGDEVYQAGAWSAIEGVTVFGTLGDLVSIRWSGGGTQSGPIENMGKARRLVVEPSLGDRIAAYAAESVAAAPEATPELVDAVRAIVHPRVARPAKGVAR